MAALIRPTVEVHESFLAAMAEFDAEGRAESNSMIGADLRNWSTRWGSAEGFGAYVDAVHAQALEETPRPVTWVPDTTLRWVEGVEWIGRLSIRHRLAPMLREVGGHIGYDVRASR